MKMIKATILILALAALFTTVASAVVVSGASYYTKVNMWFENPERIPSTNYHVGSMIPVGTKVDILKITKQEVMFRDQKGINYTIQHIAKFSGPLPDYLDACFSAENILESEIYKKLSVTDKASVAAGTITEGMSKEAVLMAYGNPPTHRTPSITGNRWTYWENRFKTMVVTFGPEDTVTVIVR